MKGKVFKQALLNGRNIFAGLASALITVIAQPYITATAKILSLHAYNALALAAVLAVYFGFVLQSYTSPKFFELLQKKEQRREIYSLDKKTVKMARQVKKKLNRSYYDRLCSVMEDKKQIISLYETHYDDQLYVRSIHQGLKLIHEYIDILDNFAIRKGNISRTNLSQLEGRMNENARKLAFTRNHYESEQLRKILEADERLLKALTEEKKELEDIAAKLDYMQTNIHILRQQLFSSSGGEKFFEDLQRDVIEAEALNDVLQGRKMNRQGRKV